MEGECIFAKIYKYYTYTVIILQKCCDEAHWIKEIHFNKVHAIFLFIAIINPLLEMPRL